ncbi:chorismate mutase [Pseudoroseomonas wenyumeiae]|uniref:chorismate mutase n=1 Tax=Teichococcus wenyumeiae TaxID=2478470 RepID=A0A3A9J7W0_9PROT|nr:chorismate mutase [Pseudoroseomonas wenyumeiae]RKK02552.1 chorismate mutase [Pseudoroseomonas wenyumeiae]RMI15339.1 chorismate mutase [Pseudoroseomonas wenyumeiae]
MGSLAPCLCGPDERKVDDTEKSDVEARLESNRQTLDNIDAALVYIFAERFGCTNATCVLKFEYNLPPLDRAREEYRYARLRGLAKENKINQNFVEIRMRFVIDQIIQRHNEIAGEHEAPQASAT